MFSHQVKPFLRKYWIEVFSLFFYFMALFPGRINPDAEKSIRLMLSDNSSANWTALYFRILQFLTLNGRTIAFASFVGLLVLALSCFYFIHSLIKPKRAADLSFRFVCIFPLMPIFGLTVQNNVFSWAGLLLLTADLFNRFNASHFNFQISNQILVCTAIFFSFTSYTGIAGVIGYLVALAVRKHLRALLHSFIFAIITSLAGMVLMVTPSEPALKYLPLLGDLKCIAQDKDSNISNEQWTFLESLGSRSNWESESSCLYADNAIFAYWKAGEIPVTNFVSNWARICLSNPRICLMAHIQRSSQALPPPFFTGQPNATESDYRIPIGANSKRSLQVFNEVIIDAPIAGSFETQQIPYLSGLESIVLMGAFVLNQNSKFWGWGGFWLFCFFVYLVFNHRKALIVLVPSVTQLGLLFAASPLPDPRYAFGWIIMGLTVSVGMLTKYVSLNSRNSIFQSSNE